MQQVTLGTAYPGKDLSGSTVVISHHVQRGIPAFSTCRKNVQTGNSFPQLWRLFPWPTAELTKLYLSFFLLHLLSKARAHTFTHTLHFWIFFFSGEQQQRGSSPMTNIIIHIHIYAHENEQPALVNLRWGAFPPPELLSQLTALLNKMQKAQLNITKMHQQYAI